MSISHIPLIANMVQDHHPHNECPEYDTKQSDGEVPVMLELQVMQSTPLLPSFPGLFWLWMVALFRALSMS